MFRNDIGKTRKNCEIMIVKVKVEEWKESQFGLEVVGGGIGGGVKRKKQGKEGIERIA